MRQHRKFESCHLRQPLWIDEGINSDLRIAQPREKRIVYTLVIEVVDAYAIVQKRSLQSAGHFGERGGWKIKAVAGRG